MSNEVSSSASPSSRRLFTRRRVLAGLGAVGGAGVLAAGGVFAYDRYRRFGRTSEASVPDHRIDLPAALPRMVIARGAAPAQSVRAAVERLGGMSQFVQSSDVVVVKPNIGWDRTAEQGANTHPDVVAEVVRLCREARARRVIVCDCPVKQARSTFEKSGILAAASGAGAEVILPEDSRYRRVHVSQRLGTWDILEPFVIATKVINVPVAKHHSLTGVTCGLKNWFGVTAIARMMLHGDVQRSIAELAALMRPTLTIVDATRVLMEQGPAGGNLADVKSVRTIAAGIDPVALDAWALGLFPNQPVPASLGYAAAMGLGRADWATLSPVEIVAG
jgi:uncharacterized protein (DUF362 family)